jgi:DNA polymerase-3 subunit gamma/tau
MTDKLTPETAADNAPYRVLARKYRPATFVQLIGQEAMVRTLTNAFASGRLAHAFILTGVRGVGKTTTARIIARALNCVGPNGDGGPTIEPCGQCEPCRAIAGDRHVDVIEMDAASRSKVDEMRELLDGVRYRPASARYKVYIIDEVHMLSTHSFNALLKTLEEPPQNVTFIFATTEVRKVPVTVLSRCQRFDLRRVDEERLSTHFSTIVEAEGVSVSAPALHLIARAADGSVRDGLSLLDQAIAQVGVAVGEDEVRRMLGLADRGITFDLMDRVMQGDMAAALGLMAEQYEAGADPAAVIEDMLDVTHWLTRVKVVPAVAEGTSVPEAERVRGRDMADRLSMAALARGWQMLLKGLGEVRVAPAPLQAAEMVLVRLAYTADLPTPAEAVRAVSPSDGEPPSAAPQPVPAASSAAPNAPDTATGPAPPSGADAPVARAVAAPPARAEERKPDPASFAEVVALADGKREAMLRANLYNNVHLVSFAPGRIEFHPGDHAPSNLAHQLSRFLNDNTARRWVVTVESQAGQPTLQQQADGDVAAAKAEVASHPLVRAVMETFPGATIGAMKKLDARAGAGSGLADGEPSEEEKT